MTVIRGITMVLRSLELVLSFTSMERNLMPSRHNRSRRGAEIIEFTLVLLPLMAMLTVIVDLGWAVFAKSTLQRAVRLGVRTGITITGTEANAAGSCLTPMVKSAVQQNALGLLGG